MIKCFSVHNFEISYLNNWASKLNLKLDLTHLRLTKETVHLAEGCKVVCCWANDLLNDDILTSLKNYGVEMISLRSAGYSHLSIETAKQLNLTVARVPAYSPQAIAEHAVGLLMSLNRKLPRSFSRVKDLNFTLDGLEGITLFGKTAGVIGVGKIGQAFASIMRGFGCDILLHDVYKDDALAQQFNAQYVELNQLLSQSDVISLHCPLNAQTHHLIHEKNISLIKESAFLINTGRGGLIETKALITQLKHKKIRGVGLDVYEYEEGIFFHDHSQEGISDENLLRLLTFPNVLITSHQAFMTKEALDNIAGISLSNAFNYLEGNNIDQDNLLISQQQRV